ncbi:MAG: Na+/H+ antiporter subunit G [Burkholderiaceae bacterium]|nr:Na+/H+ antiporter subunit G [Burkholderiaceae bacterium]
MNMLLEWTIALLIVLAAFFLLVGAVGLVRLPDFYMRLHAPTKASTLGVGGILLASILFAMVQGRFGLAELLISLFVFVTAPVSANLMAQAALHLNLSSDARVPDDAVPERAVLHNHAAAPRTKHHGRENV